MKTPLVILLVAIVPAFTAAFISQPSRVFFATSLQAGPFDKFVNREEYDKTVEGRLMLTKGLTREEAQKDYDTYLENPTNYALTKGEEYYKS